MAEDEAQGNDESPTEGVKETASDAKEAVTGGNAGSIVASLKRKEVWIPVAASAATAVAGLAARKGPELGRRVKEKRDETADDATAKLGEKGKEAAQQALQGASESGGLGGMAAGVASKAFGGGGGGGGKGKTRRLQIQRWTDVAVPVERAYELWTDFEEYPKFMHRVLSVQQDEDEKIVWNEKIWFSKRQWEAEIVEQSENEFISWKTVSGASHAGVVSFHEIDDNLTRVMVTMDFRPTGMFEKMASGLRFVKRAVQADLARFKSYAEFQQAGLEDPQSRLRAEEEDSDGDEDEERERGDDEQPEARGDESRDEGDGGEEPTAGQGDDEDGDAEAERQERERRREDRREQVTA